MNFNQNTPTEPQAPIFKDVSDFIIETEDFTVSCITNIPDYEVLPPVLIENILYKGDNMLLYGPTKSYKSFLLLMLAIAIATGGEWLGFKCSEGNVLIIEFENGQAMTYERIKAILKENGINEDCLSRISIITLKKRADINTLVNGLIKNIPPQMYSAIIIDPIYKLLSGGESQAEIVDTVLSKIDELSKKLKTSIILSHHTKKEGQNYQNIIDRISGSGLIGRDMSALIGISSVSKKDDYKRERIETELRHFPQQSNFYININGTTYTKEEPAESHSDKNSTKNKSETKAEQFENNLVRYYKFLEKKVGEVTVRDFEELTDASKNTVKKYINAIPGFSIDNGVVKYIEEKNNYDNCGKEKNH